jgi:hypothetical protein
MSIQIGPRPTQLAVRAAAAPAANNAPSKPEKGHGVQVGVGTADILWKLLSQSGKADDLKELTKAKSQDEALGTLVSSVAVLAVEGTGVKNLDKQLHDNYKGTIDKYVTDPTANKILTGVGNIFGDKVASVLISAALGDLATIVQDVRRDPAMQAQMKDDPAAFGKAVLARAGNNLPKDVASAFVTTKIKDIPVIGWFSFLIAPFVVKHVLG